MKFQALNKETWQDLQILFGEKGACGGCWCMYWRLTHKKFQENKGLKNKRSFNNLINDHYHLGILAYDNDIPVGWCSISPKTELPRLKTSRLFKNTEDSTKTWSITCLYIHKDHRRKGLSSRMISAACKYAFENGASAVEAYPILPKKEMAPAFAWVGFSDSFRKAEFEEVTRVSETRCIMKQEYGKGLQAYDKGRP